jgi:hypothetical protein
LHKVSPIHAPLSAKPIGQRELLETLQVGQGNKDQPSHEKLAVIFIGDVKVSSKSMTS